METILVVDDEIDIVEMYTVVLEEFGYNVLSATDALKAFDTLKNNKVDLIISGMQMPVVSGLRFFLLMKQYPKFQNIPFIIVSAIRNEEVIRDALEMGVFAYITKPPEITQLILEIKKALQTERKSSGIITQTSSTSESTIVRESCNEPSRQDKTNPKSEMDAEELTQTIDSGRKRIENLRKDLRKRKGAYDSPSVSYRTNKSSSESLSQTESVGTNPQTSTSEGRSVGHSMSTTGSQSVTYGYSEGITYSLGYNEIKAKVQSEITEAHLKIVQTLGETLEDAPHLRNATTGKIEKDELATKIIDLNIRSIEENINNNLPPLPIFMRKPAGLNGESNLKIIKILREMLQNIESLGNPTVVQQWISEYRKKTIEEENRPQGEPEVIDYRDSEIVIWERPQGGVPPLRPQEAKNETFSFLPARELEEKVLASDKDNRYFYDFCNFIKRHWEQYKQESLQMMEVENQIYEENFALIGKFLMVVITTTKAFIYKHFRENIDLIENISNLANTLPINPTKQDLLGINSATMPTEKPESPQPDQKEQVSIKSPLDIVEENIKLLSLSEQERVSVYLQAQIEQTKQQIDNTIQYEQQRLRELTKEEKKQIREKYVDIEQRRNAVLSRLDLTNLTVVAAHNAKKKALEPFQKEETLLKEEIKSMFNCYNLSDAKVIFSPDPSNTSGYSYLKMDIHYLGVVQKFSLGSLESNPRKPRAKKAILH